MKAEIEVFKFGELSDKVKEKVISEFRENYPNDWWHDDIIDNKQKHLDSIGYINAEINYTGFWSQGDGASFTADIDIEEWLANKISKPTPSTPVKTWARLLKLLKEGFIEVDGAYVRRDKWHNYVHENTITAYVTFNIIGNEEREDKYTNIENALEEIEAFINTEIKELSREIYSTLDKEYSSLTSDEVIKKEIIERDNVYFVNGSIATHLITN